MSSYALVKDGKVSNIILWDGISSINIEDGTLSVEVKDGEDCKIGWSYDSGEFISPKLPEIPEPTKEESIAQAESQKKSIISSASQSTQVLQTQLLLGIISDADKEKLIVWMKYIQAIQAVDTSNAPDVKWPDPL